MSLIPGPQGTKVQLVDGAQVDLISALTSGNGVQLEGQTTATSSATGFVGEKVSIAVPSFSGSTTRNTNQTVCSLVLPSAGYWDIYCFAARSFDFSALTGGLGMFAYTYLNDGSGLIAQHNVLINTGAVLRTNAIFNLLAPNYYCSTTKTIQLQILFDWWASTETFTCTTNYIGAISGNNGFYAIRRR